MTEKLQNALNEQITAELWSANLYLSMSFYLEREGFSGMARWMQKQSAEETGRKLFDDDAQIVTTQKTRRTASALLH